MSVEKNSSDDEMSEESIRKLFEESPDSRRDEYSTTSKELQGRTVPPVLSTDRNKLPQKAQSQNCADKDEEISGYIHNLSPLKQGKFFDFQLQAQDRTVRGICFSPPKRKRFEQFSNAGSPVKIKKFRIDTKSNAEDYVMGNDVSIENCPDINFEKKEMATTMNISTAINSCIGQIVTLKGKVVYLHPAKYVGSQNLQMQEAVLVDPFSTTKFILWEEFVGTVQEGNTYLFDKVRVKKDKYSGEIFLNTAMSGSTITIEQPFEEMLTVAVDLPITTTKVELKGVDKVTNYLSCYKCEKKIEDTELRIVTCSNCHFKQKKSACEDHWYAQVVVEEVGMKKRLDLTLFDEAIRQAILVAGMGCSEKADNLSKDAIEDMLLSLPESFTMTYNKRSKVVSNISM